MNSGRRPDLLVAIPDLNGGGAERVVVNLANRLVRRGFRVSIAIFAQKGPLWSKLDLGVAVTNLGTGTLRRSLRPLLEEVHRTCPRVIFSTLGYVNVAILAMRSLFPRDTRVWIREANLPSISLANNRGSWLMHLAYQVLYRRADLVICSSERMAGELRTDFAVPSVAIRMLPNPVDEDEIRDRAGGHQGRAGGGRLFVGAGRLVWQKGFDRLLRFMAALPDSDSRLTVLGEGPQAEELLRLAADLGIAERVSFEGFVDNPWACMAIADALLLPSRWEGMPNVALEALACGLPVIATPESGGIVELAAASAPGAVSVAKAGPDFIAAMNAIVPNRASDLRPSLLPREFHLDAVVEKFAGWLDDAS